jgi:hypothetical protein
MYSFTVRCVRLHKLCYWLNLVDWDQKVAKPWLTVGLSFYHPTAQQKHWGSLPVIHNLHHKLRLFYQSSREVLPNRHHQQVREQDGTVVQFSLLILYNNVPSSNLNYLFSHFINTLLICKYRIPVNVTNPYLRG